MSVEIAAVRAAAAAGVPTATVVAASRPTQPISASAYMILERVDGETTPRKILRDEQYAAARSALPAQLADALVRIHAIDPAQVPGVADTDQVAAVPRGARHARPTAPDLRAGLPLARGQPTTDRQAGVVHGDFRLGNVIVDDEGLVAVLDWELVHLGDPMEDLGWLCVKSWRFGSAKPVAGVGEYEQLFEAYEARRRPTCRRRRRFAGGRCSGR